MNELGPAQAIEASAIGAPAQSPSERAATRTDADLIEQFLRERCSRSANTEASYRSHLRRLGWFCRHIGLRSIRELQREHWPDYQAYLRDPPAEHVMAASVGFGQPGWAPFRGPMSDRSAKQAEIVARAFFGFLSDPAIGALQIDPVRSIRTHSARRSATVAGVSRHLTEQQKAYVMRAIDAMPMDTVQQRRHRARCRWVVTLAMLTGLRASEIAAARRRDVVPGRLAGSFSLKVLRKGGIESLLPLHTQVVVAMKEHLALYEAGLTGASDLPLVLPVRDADLRSPVRSPTRAHVWRIIKDIMISASDLAFESGDHETEQSLRSASTHWLRHTFATDLIDSGADLVSARDLLDHASISTTSQYLHRPEEKLRADLERLGSSDAPVEPQG